MNRIFLLFLCMLLCLSLFLGCTPQSKRYEASFYNLFDTLAVIKGYADSEASFRAEAERIRTDLFRYHRLFDIYNNYPGLNNLKTVNDQAGGDPIVVDPAIIDLLLFGLELYRQTGRRVDITLGPVLRVWHDAYLLAEADPTAAAPPQQQTLQEAYLHTGLDKLEIDPAACTVRLTDPFASLDVGAIAKGFAVECVCKTLPSGWLLSVGGNVRAVGARADGTSWTVGVRSPDAADDLSCTLSVSDTAVVTSGDYQRLFWADGVAYHHIIDPDTLFPASRWRSVTVLCPDSALADGLSTALFLLDSDSGQSLLDYYGAEALWIAPDGSHLTTAGFEQAMSSES